MNNSNVFLALAATVLLPSAAFAQTTPAMNPEGNQPAPKGNEMFATNRPAGAQTEITAQQEATFNNQENKATFTGKVVVKDPQFTLFCEHLIVYMNENRKGLREVEAIGNVVIVQENVDEKGNPTKSIGRSGKALFNPATGDITLTESPQIQQGINNHVSVEPSTVMLLNRAGRLTTQGASRTVIVDANDGALTR